MAHPMRPLNRLCFVPSPAYFFRFILAYVSAAPIMKI